ncbi:hypothetical protein Cob_v012726 [Colletotrichum orbiculare MAFF 240422]|uniref:Uncharacterized protein n=1 Tax=Colletotrichum orbiculare (strain 104-T / ATCC 96160 / CBS 514.97 / LARS 414 / MAFF 240422) TaxID=1213857 RepID=A0A484F8I5_COLOR|nr:hypothetical protein Cob_v012726 [Colletotrichum orbiculare MAFF 240422]
MAVCRAQHTTCLGHGEHALFANALPTIVASWPGAVEGLAVEAASCQDRHDRTCSSITTTEPPRVECSPSNLPAAATTYPQCFPPALAIEPPAQDLNKRGSKAESSFLNILRNACHQLHPGVIVVFCIVFLVAVGVIGLWASRLISRKKAEKAAAANA